MVAASYGNYSPREDQPYPIETELAKLAATSPAQAQNMLDTYQLQRQTAGNNYDLAMQGQHEFAKQQLAQQLYEAKIKAAPEYFKTPGLARVAGSQGLLEGVSDADLATSVAQAENAIGATNLEHAGAGVNSFSQAGYGIPIAAVQNITGVNGIVPQTPRDIQVAQINAAGRVAAANAGGSAGPSLHFTGQPEPGLGGGSIGASFGPKTHATPDDVRRWAQKNGLTPQGLTSLPPAQTDGGGTKQPPAAPPAQRPAAAAAPGVKPVFDQVRTAIEANRSKLGEAAYNDLQAGMKANGGNPIIKMGPDGKNHLYGASGKPYS